MLTTCPGSAVSFLLYFNRVFASIVSYIIRAYTWHRFRIHIDIQALQVSLLGGRVFFTGFRYHGNNETILVQNGHITWSYWLWRVRDVDVGGGKATDAGDLSREDAEDPLKADVKSTKLPCRINIAISGLEWFIYNRSPVYESILAAMTDTAETDEEDATGSENLADGLNQPRQRLQKASQKVEEQLRKLDSRYSAEKDQSNDAGEKTKEDGHVFKPSSTSLSEDAAAPSTESNELPLMLQLLPIHFECNKGAVVMGNENTKAILVFKTRSLAGEINATECQSPDPYRQTFKIDFDQPVVEMKDNVDYKEDQLTRAVKDKQIALESDAAQNRPFFRRQRRKMAHQMRNLVPYWRSSVESFSVDSRQGPVAAENRLPGSNHWQGLSRYLNDDDEDDKIRWSSVEYAAVPTLLESPAATLTIFWDVPGKVTPAHHQAAMAQDDQTNNINGAPPPAWAINFSIKGGTINYGPWADRHRAEIQRVFNPTLSKDAVPANKLAAGADRVPTQFKLLLEIDEEVTLRVPTREDSKNWRWKKEVAELRQHRKQERRRGKVRNRDKVAKPAAQQRPNGWLEVKVAANASVSYTMDMVAGKAGFKNRLDVELPTTEISTSVNHGLLWKSGPQRISCDMSAPLKWNTLRNWHFDITGEDLELFILRDHIFLLVDLIDDWGSGPPQDYLLYTPFKYLLNLEFRNLKLYLNVNDVNIVNNPTDMEENTYLVLSSPCLKADTCISLDTFRPSKNMVPFNVQAETLAIALHLPSWNTQATFLTSREIGQLENIQLEGGYHYNATTSTSNTDTLVLNVGGQSPVATLHGFLVRYLLQLKDNYFGEHVHFKTLDEYQEMLRLDPEAEAAMRPPQKKSNDMDVILAIRLDDPKIMLPANIYSSKRHIDIETPGLAVDLRFTNYYMDLDLILSPLSLSFGSEDDGATSPLSATSSTQMFIDGFEVYGHRLFGLPPVEPTYLCNWDLSVGAITGECTTDFLTALISGGKAFGFSMDDDENALIPASVVVYDATFLRVCVQSIQLWIHVDEAAFLFSTDAIDVNFNDWARTHYSKRADVTIPGLQIACVNSESAARQKSRLHSRVETDALVRTSIRFTLIGRKHGFSEARKLQQELIRREDQRTHRTDFLLLPGFLDPVAPDPVEPPAQSVPTVPQPTIPIPSHDERKSIRSFASSQRSRQHQRKSSFLSFSSGSSASVLRPGSAKTHYFAQETGRQTPASRSHPLGEIRPTMRARQYSASTGRHSAFYSAYGDHAERKDQSHNTVSFSSQFFAPYFPLDNITLDTREATLPNTEMDSEDAAEPSQFGLEDVDPELLSQETVHQSFLIELPTGVTAFLNATALQHIASLLGALQPTEPDDILDTIQTSAMGAIFDRQKQEGIEASMTDVMVKVPYANIRFLNCSDLDAPQPDQQEQDQYDLSIRKLTLANRSGARHAEAGSSGGGPTRSSFHLRLESTEISAAERPANIAETQAAVRASVENTMISFGSKEVSYADADVGALRVSTSSGKVEYLAALIHRTNVLADEMGALFSQTLKAGDDRPKQFAHSLLAEGAKVGDPPFIVRPSAVLRAATEHLRTYDSWKLAARLRQVWENLGNDTQEQLRFDCFSGTAKYPEDARQLATKAFREWRGWDLGNIEGSYVMNNIFGKVHHPAEAGPKQSPFLAVFRLREVQLLLDPGPKQNQIFAMDITTRVQSNTPDASKVEALANDTQQPLTVLNVYCAQAGINLNWELLELVEDVLRLYRHARPQEAPGPVVEKPKPKKPTRREAIQVAFSLGRGNILFETVNLRSETQSNVLSLSVLMTEDSAAKNINAILACDDVSTKLRSHQQALATFRLRKPSVFVSHELREEDTTSIHTIKSTASSEDLKLFVKQDPIVLAEVVDTVVRDELAQLYQLRSEIPSAPPQPKPARHKVSDRLTSFRVDLAMFLNTYTITVPLLRSITYTISGVVARASMAANFGKEIVFDFDIKENSHDMQIRVNNVPRSISLLQIPPTNGRIASRIAQGEHSITVFASVELIQLDASAVYSLLAALNRPEMSNAINDLQLQAKVIQEHAAEVFGPVEGTPPESKTTEPDDSKLVYVVHTTLAGIEIFGNTPIKSDTAPLAQLLFHLGSVHLKMANRLDQTGPLLENPEVHINLRRILFDIKKGSLENMRTCGNLSFAALATATTREGEDGKEQRSFDFQSDGFEVNLSADTTSTLVDALGYMGDKIKDLDTTKEIGYLQKRLRQSRPRIAVNDEEEAPAESASDIFDSFLASIMYSFVIHNIQISWLISPGDAPSPGYEDLVLSFKSIEFATRKKNTAKLTIEDFQLQLVAPEGDRTARTANSALLPEVIFNVASISTAETRRLAFQAVGKSLDLRLTSGFIIPAAHVTDSIGQSVKNVQQASEKWTPIVATTDKPADKAVGRPAGSKATEKSGEKAGEKPARQRSSLFGSKRMESVLVDADFAGAVVHLSGKKTLEASSKAGAAMNRPALAGKYGQFSADDAGSSTVLRTPGLAWKIEYRDDGKDDEAVYGEIQVDASKNILYPAVVPLIMEITSSIKEVVSQDDKGAQASPSSNEESSPADKPVDKSAEEENILTADPSQVLGRTKLNIGLRIRRQEFTLSCQPIARVAGTACFEDIYITFNTVHSLEHGNFFAISGTFNKFHTSVQHVYSRESTGSFEVDSIVLSFMNSKHVSGTSGLSAILKVSPMKVEVNAKQLQDFLLFREIWVPQEIRQGSAAPVATQPTSQQQQQQQQQGHLVQRYQQVAATAAFPWTATISIASLDVKVDLGQSIGRSNFAITDFWISSKKTSDWQQNLCLGFQSIGIECTGRLSGFIALQKFKLRTSIEWPERQAALNETPRIQASIGFSHFRLKAVFDYQAFLVADITSMNFLMYNVRQGRRGSGDRLVADFDGDAVQVFGTTSSAAQGVALWQAVQKLIQERTANFESSLRDIEKFTKRKASLSQGALTQAAPAKPASDAVVVAKSPISLDTDVVVTLRALNLGVFPNTFSDHQVFKLEALNAQARFAAGMQNRRIHSTLGLTLGQLRIGLAGVRGGEAPKASSEISVDDVVASATGSRGGTILKVPQVEAVMQTWQTPESRTIDYIFKSAFEGKVEVGWNYSRISYIRGMWATHSKALAAVWGRDLPEMNAIKVTGVPAPSTASGSSSGGGGGDGDGSAKDPRTKITAEVNVPQSKYEYVALEPPVIETPQLRDMGEATPPLEWIGLHRERLPNLTHQIIIVSLLELAGEVEDMYGKVIGI